MEIPAGLPRAQGLYDPRHEHDACGVGFVAHIKGKKSHDIVSNGLTILNNLTHRGATGADPLHGDGAGILVQIPDGFFREEMARQGVKLPKAGAWGVGMVFLPQDPAARAACVREIERAIANEGQALLGWRDVPVDPSSLGHTAKSTMPVIRQVFVGAGRGQLDRDAFERKLYIIRKASGHAIRALGLTNAGQFYVPSFSHRTIVYKGMLLAHQVGEFFTDLHDKRFVSALALAHQRFSTNTFPTWDLAHPFRFIAHNGEINTLQGNLNWIRSRQATIHSKLLGPDLDKIWPLIYEGQSDSASFDNALELLVMGGYPIAHAMMLMIPEAWAGNPLMDAKRRAFYEYHAALMEPWDGPAAVAFTDGKFIGATLDRNGLRPARYFITDDDLIVMSSEMGVLDIPQSKIVKKWRLQPGKMLLVDIEHGHIVSDEELKRDLAADRPYQDWLDRTQMRLEDLPSPGAVPMPDTDKLLDRQQAFGYTQEDLKMLLTPMAVAGEEPVGSMGDDTPVAVLSNRPKPLYAYFRQLFAQVTNPPIDPIREQLVMSLVSFIGPRPNLLSPDSTEPVMRLEVSQPILTFEDMEKLRRASESTNGHFVSEILSMCYPAEWGTDGMEPALARLCADAEDAVKKGVNIIILTDRDVCAEQVPIPALLATAAVHHHLVRAGLRTRSRPGGRDRQRARGAALRLPRRLRRRGDPPQPRLRHALRHQGRAAAEGRRQGAGQALHQGDRQGPAQGDVQDGHLHLPVVLRRADLRGRGPQHEVRGEVLHRHAVDDRGHRPEGSGRGGRAPAPPGLLRRAPVPRPARPGRRLRLPHPRRGAHVDAGHDREAPARDALGELLHVQGIREAHQRAERAPHDAARALRDQDGGDPGARSTRSSPPRRS